MKREQRERMVDRALAWALRPEQVEPREGFEERLLARLAAQPQRRAWWRWMWVPAIAAAAVLAIVLGIQALRRPAPIIESHHTTAPARQPALAANIPAQAPQVVRHKPVLRAQPRVQLAQAAAALPKQDVFPTPVPPTEQERMLLALVLRRPQQAQKIAAEQESERQRVEMNFEPVSGSGEPNAAQQMR